MGPGKFSTQRGKTLMKWREFKEGGAWEVIKNAVV